MFRALGNPASTSPRRPSMSNVNIFSDFKTAINPCDIFTDANKYTSFPMSETLGKYEYAQIALRFIYASQKCDEWVGIIYEDRRVESDRSFAKMIELDFLAEKQVEGGWLYELTQFAIEQIYVRQTILHFKTAVTHAHGITFWARVRKLFTSPPYFV